MIHYISFIIVTLSIPLVCYHTKFINKNETFCILLASIAHIVFSYIDASSGTLLNSVVDTKNFYSSALSYLEANKSNIDFRNGAYFYSSLLAILFKLTLPSIFISNLSSSFFSILTCLIFIRFLKLLEIRDSTSLMLLIAFSFFPSNLIFCSITLRESLQLLALMQSTFFLIALYKNNIISVKSHFIFFLSIIVLGLLHFALIYISYLILFIYFAHKILYSNKRVKKYIILISVFLLLIANEFVFKKTSIVSNLNLLFLMESINSYRMRAEIDFIGNTNYYILIDHSSFFTSLKSISQIYLTYLFKPFLYEINSLSTLYASVESLLRLAIILFVMYTYLFKRQFKKYTFILLIVFFITSFMWSLGTFNFGQAVRHHILTNWILLLLAGISFEIIKSKNNNPSK